MESSFKLVSTSIWGHPTPPHSQEHRMVTIRVGVHLTGRPPHRITAIRIPLALETLASGKRRNIQVVSATEETNSSHYGNFACAPGIYRLTSALSPAYHVTFQVPPNAAHPVASFCSHGGPKPSKVISHDYLSPKGVPLVGDATVLKYQCCAPPAKRTASNHEYLLALLHALKGPFRLTDGVHHILLKEGEYCLVNPRSQHAISHDQQWPVLFNQIIFFQPLLREVRDAVGLPSALGDFDFDPRPRRLSQEVRQGLAILKSATTASFGQDELVHASARTLLITLLNHHPNNLSQRWQSPHTSGGQDVRITRALAHLDGHLVAPLALDALGKIAGVSRRQILRLFQEHLGTSPMEYLADRRARRAIELLKTTHDTVDAIAAAVGLSEARSLSRLLKRTQGLRPSDLR